MQAKDLNFFFPFYTCEVCAYQKKTEASLGNNAGLEALAKSLIEAYLQAADSAIALARES